MRRRTCNPSHQLTLLLISKNPLLFLTFPTHPILTSSQSLPLHLTTNWISRSITLPRLHLTTNWISRSITLPRLLYPIHSYHLRYPLRYLICTHCCCLISHLLSFLSITPASFLGGRMADLICVKDVCYSCHSKLSPHL